MLNTARPAGSDSPVRDRAVAWPNILLHHLLTMIKLNQIYSIPSVSLFLTIASVTIVINSSVK